MIHVATVSSSEFFKSTTRVHNNTATRLPRFFCATQQAFLLSQTHWGRASPSRILWKVTRIQIRNESWQKVATFVTIRIAVLHDARTKNGFPEVQHDVGCMLRGTILHKLLCPYRQAICFKLRQEVVLEHMQISFRVCCFIKEILDRLSIGWTWQPRRRPSFCDCCLHRRSQEVLSPTTAWSLCSQPLQNKNKPRSKTICWNEFNFFFYPGCELKSAFFVIWRFIKPKDFVWEHFRIHSKYFLHWAPRRSVLTSCLPCSHVRTARTLLILHTPLLLKLFELRSIVFLAGAQRVWKIVRNLLCMSLTLFVSANTKTTLELCSTVIRHFNEMPTSRWV